MAIEDELRSAVVTRDNSTVVIVPLDLIQRAIKEIEWLRSLAGAVTQGESFDGIAQPQGRRRPTEEQAS